MHCKKFVRKFVATVLIASTSFHIVSSVNATSTSEKKTSIKSYIYAQGRYINWDGISNVSQFVDSEGNYCFSYLKGQYVVIVKTKNGSPQKETLKLELKYPIFGGVISDSKGNYYIVTGNENTTDDTTKDTIFISKYDSKGKHIKTVGDNGSSSLAYYYDSSFYTKYPFDGGNCDLSINGDVLAVNYAREMYSGHQSNSVFTVNVETMEPVSVGRNYNSHSFAQRVIPYQDGFAFASEGDCFPRSFSITTQNTKKEVTTHEVFHFGVKQNAYSDWDMGSLNCNYAHMGGLAAINDKYLAFVGTSAKSLSYSARKEKEQLFIQIFDPSQDTTTANAYLTKGERTGLSGPNGDKKVTDYGVKWLTNGDKNTTYQNPQVVSDANGKIIVLYEKYVKDTYKGVYYLILDETGKVIKKSTCFSKTSLLNPCRMPVYTKGSVYWSGNKQNDDSNYIYIYRLKL